MVLPGWTAFCHADATRAGRSLLAGGQAIRIKPGHGIGGSGQSIVASEQELDAALRAIDAANLQRAGVVLELDLASAQTFSVGTLHVGNLQLAYCGTQWQTRNHAGHSVYGGSRLHCLRGDLDSLLQRTHDEVGREAIAATARYDAEVSRAYPQFFASRRNYDVVRGQDTRGITRCGVLEQSWRVGGASPAEVRALEAMNADPDLQRITTSSHELYALTEVPDGAEVSFRGDDPVVGAITKFSSDRRRRASWTSGLKPSNWKWRTSTSAAPCSRPRRACPGCCSCTAGAAARNTIWCAPAPPPASAASA